MPLLQHGWLPCRRVRTATSRARGAVDPRVACWGSQEAVGLGRSHEQQVGSFRHCCSQYIYNALRRAAVCCLKHSALCGVAATPLKVTVALTFCPFWLLVTTWSGLIRLMGPGGPGMVRNAMAKRFPLESPEALESIAPYLYQITAARGSGEYALNLLLEPGAWARRPLCERLLPLQGGKLSSPINHICVSCSRSDALPLARAHFLNTVTL